MELFFNLKQLLKSELDETLYLPFYLRLLAFFTVPFDYSNEGRSYRSARSYFAQVQFWEEVQQLASESCVKFLMSRNKIEKVVVERLQVVSNTYLSLDLLQQGF